MFSFLGFFSLKQKQILPKDQNIEIRLSRLLKFFSNYFDRQHRKYNIQSSPVNSSRFLLGKHYSEEENSGRGRRRN